MRNAGLLGMVDALDVHLCRLGILSPATWRQVQSGKIRNLYAGRLSRSEPQYSTFVGLTPFAPSANNIEHDLNVKFPIPDGCIDKFQSQDVFEHIEYEKLPSIINEIYRVLKPGGVFRLSVPDYRCSVYRERSRTDSSGKLIFDPGGGGAFQDGQVIQGGHLWFPDREKVQALFDATAFGSAPGARIRFLHYNAANGQAVLEPIDYSLGYIKRTPDHDSRAAGRRQAISIVVDAIKARPCT